MPYSVVLVDLFLQKQLCLLIKSKCILVLIYVIEACPTYSSDIKMLDDSITTTFMKVVNTKSPDVVRDCQMAFGCRSLKEQILTRKINFVKNYLLSKLN